DKTRCAKLDGQVIPKPGKQVAQILSAWLSDGAEPAPAKAPETKAPQVDPAYTVARNSILIDMRSIYLSQGKDEDEWAKYAMSLSDKTAEQLETMLASWQKAAKAKAAAATAQAEPEPETETI